MNGEKDTRIMRFWNFGWKKHKVYVQLRYLLLTIRYISRVNEFKSCEINLIKLTRNLNKKKAKKRMKEGMEVIEKIFQDQNAN